MRRRLLVSFFALLAVADTLAAARLEVVALDQKGNPAAPGVVEAVPLGAAAGSKEDPAVMDQIQEAFVPHILPVVVGARVSFPNRDDIRHHVYSFSDVKKFELPLYKGTPAEPVVFDQPGVVVLGCNIHDHMRGYIYIAESTFFSLLGEDGKAEVGDLPAGEYEVRVWHPRSKKAPPTQKVLLTADGTETLEFALQLKPSLRRRGSAAAGKKY